ncbi:MAG: hydantoinase/oxoprolinase family protein [Desulfohalobiaceae bacterium]|nr:hydantoinase/oxoprolinase family protein [Desulfohalobiaceae bacterium]
MILGIDVGGTHTDAVLLHKQGLVATAKVETNHEDLLSSVCLALEGILKEDGMTGLKRFNLSTTLCTNAIVQGELNDVGVLVSAGPGINPAHYRIGGRYELIPGGLDHRGTEIVPQDSGLIERAIQENLDQGVKVFSFIGKFSPRNPAHELQMAKGLKDRCDFVTLGHTLSGQLNFPRRIATAYYNSAVWPVFNKFANSVETSLKQLGLTPPHMNILKADGGTMTLTQARQTPVESIFSGPSASIMGCLAMCCPDQDALLLDVGGTTTDMAVYAAGAPLVETESMDLVHRPTLVRAMKSKSIGLGGDSAVSALDGQLSVGPKRLGPSLARGGEVPTLVDALNLVQGVTHGSLEASRQGIRELGGLLGLSAEDCALRIIEAVCRELQEQARAMLARINEKPVYTVHELLEYREIKPKIVYLMGGPARMLAPLLQQKLDLPVSVPDYYQVANAMGAALAKPTMEAELFADTGKHVLRIPVLGVNHDISGGYTLDQARQDVVNSLLSHVSSRLDWNVPQEEVEIIEESEMNMVNDVYQIGRDIRVKAQIKPGIVSDYQQAVR